MAQHGLLLAQHARKVGTGHPLASDRPAWQPHKSKKQLINIFERNLRLFVIAD
jgi:hypothetical protein